MQKIKTIFAGTPDFALPSLKALIEDNNFEVVAAITQPDKKVGRKQVLTSPPVKKTALDKNIPVLQPEDIRNIKDKLYKLDPDLIVVVAYGQIINEEILNLPKYGCFNLHGSLLPKYRGAAVIQAPILNGDEYSGVTVMKMDKGLDTGPILKQNKVKLDKEETCETLHDKLAEAGAKILPVALKKYINGELKLIEQPEDEASYTPKLKREHGQIDWSEGASVIERKVRALNPFPGTYTNLEGKNLKIKKVSGKILEINKYPAGQVFLFEENLAVQCGQNALIIERLQLEGKKEMAAKDFLAGHPDLEGSILGQ